MIHAAPLTLAVAVAQLARRGIVLKSQPGMYIVNYRNGVPSAAYQTDTMADAPRPEPPLGPIGRRGTQRSRIYAHNAKIEAWRRRAALLQNQQTDNGGDDRNGRG